MKPTQPLTRTPPYLPAGHWRSYPALLAANPQFRRLWLAGVVSQLGNWLNYIAIFVLLTKLTGSGEAVSWFLIAKFLPTAFLGPAAGVVADRFSRKKIMVASDLARAVLVLGFLLVREPDQVWIIYLLALIQESIWTFSDPARRASIPNLCRPEELNVANALGGATWSLMLAAGAALGGFISAFFGWQTAIVLDSLTFLASALLLRKLRLPPPAAVKREQLSWRDYTGLNDLLEGSRYVAANGRVTALLFVKSGWALSGGILVLLTVFGEQVLTAAGQGGGSGVLYSFRGLGAALGPILAWRLFGETSRAMHLAIGAAFFVAAGSYLLVSRTETLLGAGAFVLAGHLGGSVQWVFSTNLLQRLVPDQFRGRVFAAEMAFLTLVLSLSTYVTGAALEAGMGPRTIMARLALLFMVPGSGWLFYVWRRERGGTGEEDVSPPG